MKESIQDFIKRMKRNPKLTKDIIRREAWLRYPTQSHADIERFVVACHDLIIHENAKL